MIRSTGYRSSCPVVVVVNARGGVGEEVVCGTTGVCVHTVVVEVPRTTPGRM